MLLKRNEYINEMRIQPLYREYFITIEGIRYPIKFNDTAGEIINLCDGTHSQEDIIRIMAEKYGEERQIVQEMVDEFVEQAIKFNHIELIDTATQNVQIIKTLGSKEYWTPEVVAIEITHKCPLKCKHCYVDAGEGSSIEFELIKKIFIECSTMGIKSIQLTGGEPLIHKDFNKIVDLALSYDIELHIFTSGYYYTDDILKKFEEYKGNRNILFQVSIDGLEETHDEFRGVLGSYNKSMSFIKQVIELGFRVTVGTCIDTQVYSELKELSQLIRQIGVSAHRISAISDRGRANENLIKTSNEIMKNKRRLIKELSGELNSKEFQVYYFEEGDAYIDYKYKHNCGLGQTSLKIDPDGNISPCVMSSTKYANINVMSLLEIQKKYSRLWEVPFSPADSKCMSCNSSELCNHCVIEALEYAPNEKCWFDNEFSDFDKKIIEV